MLHPQILSLEAVLFKGGRSLVYGTGRDIAFADRDAVAGIVSRTAVAGGGLHTLIREIVGSKLFQTP